MVSRGLRKQKRWWDGTALWRYGVMAFWRSGIGVVCNPTEEKAYQAAS